MCDCCRVDIFSSFCSRKSHVFTPERERQQAAAATIQHHWKHRQATHKQKKFEDERNQAALDIQSALRGHMARRQMVSSASHAVQVKCMFNCLSKCMYIYTYHDDVQFQSHPFYVN